MFLCWVKGAMCGIFNQPAGEDFPLTTIPITRFRNVSNHWIPPDITFCLLSKLLCPAHRCTYYHFQYSIRTLLVMSHILLRSSVMWIHFIIIRMNNLVTFSIPWHLRNSFNFRVPSATNKHPAEWVFAVRWPAGEDLWNFISDLLKECSDLRFALS